MHDYFFLLKRTGAYLQLDLIIDGKFLVIVQQNPVMSNFTRCDLAG